jgi:hypothetical protein
MAITHKFDNAFTITDYTRELMEVPNMWGLIGQQGLFRKESVGTNTVTFDKTFQTAALINDKPWGERSTFAGNEKSELHTFAIPTFPLDDLVTVGDVWNKRAIGSADMRASVDQVLAKKVAQIRRSHALTQEYARCQAIQGNKYAPNGTISTSTWFTEFGVTQKTVDFDFGDATVDQRTNIQEVVAHIQDNFRGSGVLEEIVFYCTPNFFANVISNAQIEAAYTYYSSAQEPLRNDLRKGMYREFVWQGVTFIEYRGATPNGTQFLPEAATGGQAWAVAKGSDTLVEYYAPAYRLDEIGSGGAEAYMWTYENQKSTNIEIMSESNFLVMNQRPDLVVKCTSTTDS